MNYQTRDIKKLKAYAKSLGVRVLTKPYNRFTGSAEYDSQSNTIVVFKKSNTTKNDIIMALLHELGHKLDDLENSHDEKEIAKALELLNSGPMVGSRLDIPKKYRAKILQTEKNGVKYMSKIHRMLKLETPFYLVKHQQELDLFDYRYLYKYGRFATQQETEDFVYSKLGEYQEKYGKRK